MSFIAYKPDINHPEWHSAFLCITEHTEMDDIQSDIQDFLERQIDNENDKAYYIFMRCQLTDETAAKAI